MFFKEKEIKACGLPVCAWPDCDGSCGATDPEQLILDWVKDPNTSAEEIVKFVRQPCTSDARVQYCSSFEDCNDCMASYLRSKIPNKKEANILWI